MPIERKVCFITVIDRVIKYFIYPHINALLDESFEITCITDFTDSEVLEKIQKPIKQFQVKINRQVDFPNLVRNIFVLYKHFKNNQYVMIQYTGPSTALICSIAGKLARVPHRVYCLWGIRFEGYKGIKRIFFRGLEKISCYLSTDILFDSNENKKFLINQGFDIESKAKIIREGSACGINLIDYNITKKKEYRGLIRDKYNLSDGTFIFGYVGRIIGEKGINELLYAFKKLIEINYNCVLLLVGFYEETNDLDTDLLHWAESCDKVIFCGRQDQPEQYYAAFDTFVFPSYREGFGGGVMQAGAFKVPSIVSDIRSLMDAIQFGQFGYYFPVGDKMSLYKVMNSVLNNHKENERIGQLMYRRVYDFFQMQDWMNDYADFVSNMIDSDMTI